MELFINEEKKVVIKATMKKVVDITKRLKGRTFKDLFFVKMNEVDFEFLATLIQAFYVKDESNFDFNNDMNKVYDFIEEYIETTGIDYVKLYQKLAEEINVKSFFGKKMSDEELKQETDNPLNGIDINKLVTESAQTMLKEVATEEFKGYKG